MQLKPQLAFPLHGSNILFVAAAYLLLQHQGFSAAACGLAVARGVWKAAAAGIVDAPALRRSNITIR